MNSKAQEYLSLVDVDCQDTWVDSGTGNMAWKPDKPKKRKSSDIPRKDILRLIAGNVSLIKTINPSEHPLVIKLIERLYNGKLAEDEFIEACMDEFDISEGRAKVIAFDQINKLKIQLKVESLKRRGIRYAVWCHEKECHIPREYHQAKWDGVSGMDGGNLPNGLDGYVFSLNDPPVVDERTGEKGLPGQLIGCCCTLKGVRLGKRASR